MTPATRRQWLDEKRREVLRLSDVATNAIVPSRRDFTQFIASQRSAVALVPRMKRRDPRTAGGWPEVDILGIASALDDTDVAAFAVATAALHGAALDDLDAMRAVVDAPILRDDLCLAEMQVYDSRLRGADAVRIPVADLADTEAARLCDIAVSLHMTPVLDVAERADLERAPVRPPHCVGLDCSTDDGFADLDRIRSLAERIPPHVVVVVLAEVRSLEEAGQLKGYADAVVVGDALLDASEPAVAAARFLGV